MNKDLMKKIEKFLENINEIKRSDSEVDFDFRTTIEIFYDMNDFYKNKKRYIDDGLSTELDVTISVVGIYNDINDQYRIKKYDVFADESFQHNNINIRKNQNITRILNKLLTREQIAQLEDEILDNIEETFKG